MKIAAISIADYAEATEGMPHDVERLFFRMLLKMYSRDAGLPDSDAENASMFGYKTVRPYKRLKEKLLAFPCGLYVEDDTIKHARVEEEIEATKARKNQARENGKKGGRPKVSTKFGESLPEVCPKFGPNLPETFPKLIPSNPDKSITYENPSPSPSPSPSNKNPLNPPSGGPGDPFGFIDPALNEGIQISGDTIKLVNGTQAYWMKEFNGDEKALRLALKKAYASRGENSREPLKKQVERSLSSSAADLHARQVNYQKAVERKNKPRLPSKITGRNVSKDGRLIGCL